MDNLLNILLVYGIILVVAFILFLLLILFLDSRNRKKGRHEYFIESDDWE